MFENREAFGALVLFIEVSTGQDLPVCLARALLQWRTK